MAILRLAVCGGGGKDGNAVRGAGMKCLGGNIRLSCASVAIWHTDPSNLLAANDGSGAWLSSPDIAGRNQIRHQAGRKGGYMSAIVQAARQGSGRRFLEDEEGASMIEYSALLTLILVVTVSGIEFLGQKLGAAFQKLTDMMNSAGL